MIITPEVIQRYQNVVGTFQTVKGPKSHISSCLYMICLHLQIKWKWDERALPEVDAQFIQDMFGEFHTPQVCLVVPLIMAELKKKYGTRDIWPSDWSSSIIAPWRMFVTNKMATNLIALAVGNVDMSAINAKYDCKWHLTLPYKLPFGNRENMDVRIKARFNDLFYLIQNGERPFEPFPVFYSLTDVERDKPAVLPVREKIPDYVEEMARCIVNRSNELMQAALGQLDEIAWFEQHTNERCGYCRASRVMCDRCIERHWQEFDVEYQKKVAPWLHPALRHYSSFLVR